MATLYYNAEVSTDWNDLGNWWTDLDVPTQATTLPTSADDVILTGSVVTNTGGAIEVSTLAMTTVAATAALGDALGVDVTISGPGYNGIFTNSRIGAGVTVTGNCEFIGSQAGAVGAASNSGTITGNALFTGDVGVLPCVVAAPVENFGTVSGNAVFDGNSRNASTGTVTGACMFNDNSYNDGTAAQVTYAGFTGGTCVGSAAAFVILGAPASGLNSEGRGTYAGDGLFYTDYPTLAEGYDNINSVYYFAGVATQLNEDGTGWDATLDDYYIEAVATGMSQLGSGFYNGDHYYLGSIFPPTTYAFMGTSNGDWNNLSNWLADYDISLPAGQLPTATDNVELRASVTSNGGGPPTVANLSTVPSNPNSNLRLDIPITVTGTATFNGEWYYTQAITGNVAFSAAAFTNWRSSYATGTTTFTSLTSVAFAATTSWYIDASLWIFDAPDPVWTFPAGTQLGSAGNIHGNVIFNAEYSSGNNSGQITGDVTFNGHYAFNYGSINGTATFNGGSHNGNQSSYFAGAVVTGTAIFNDYSYNNGTVTGDAEFSGAEFTNSSPTGSGSVSGTTTFTAAMPVVFNWGNGVSWTYDTSLWVFTTSGQNWIFSSGDNSSVIKGDAAFSGSSFNNYNGTVDGNATFAESSSNRGTVSHDATFNGSSYNTGTVSEDATFSASAFAAVSGNNPLGTLNGGVTFSSATLVTFTLDSNYGWSNWTYDSTAWSFTAPGQNWIFNGSAYNSGVLIGDATFNSSSHNDGTVSNDATFNGGYNHTSGTVSHDATFGGGYNAGLVSNDATFDGITYNNGTVSNDATFNGSSYNDYGTVYNAVFNASSYNNYSGIVTNDAVFNGSSSNRGTVTHDAVFNETSYNTGGVSGAATFSASAFAAVSGNTPLGTLNGGVTFSSPTSVTFTLDSNTGWSNWNYDSTAWSFTAPGQNWIFGGYSYNSGVLIGDATFNDISHNDGTVSNDATFDGGYNHTSGVVSNDATFGGGSYNSGTVMHDATFDGITYNNGTVSNDAVFNVSSYNYYGTVYNAVFNGSSYNNYGGMVTNDAIFNGSSENRGTVSNNATFNESSHNTGGVSHDATFSASAFAAVSGNTPLGTLNGGVTFSSPTSVTFTLDSNTGWSNWTYDSTAWAFTAPGQNWIFDGYSWNSGILIGDATFNSSSHNDGTVSNDATFGGGSYNGGTVMHDATFNTSSYNNSGSTVSNNATFNGSSTNNGTVSNDATFNESSFNTDYGTVYNAIFNGISYNNTNSAVTNDATFNVTSHNEGIVSNNATFNDNSYNSASSTVSNDATFNDSSYNAGTINGDATFNHNSYSAISASFNVGTNLVFNQNSQLRGSIDVNSVAFRENSQNTYGIGGALSAAPNTIVVAHGGGINGSNILGMF